MAEKRQQEQHLTGAYYGPSIPPPSKTYHRTSRGGTGCGCGCLRCCGCCLFSCIFNIILTVVAILGIAVLIFWLIFRPNIIKFRVSDAALTRFELNNNDNNLHYNLALNVTVRNPNRRIGIYYDRIEATAYYDNQRFAADTLTPFYQGHKNTSVMSPAFQGQNLVVFGNDEMKKLNEDKNSGIYRIELKLRLRIRFKVGLVKTWKFKPKIRCDLKVPLRTSNPTSGFEFQTTKCHLDL